MTTINGDRPDIDNPQAWREWMEDALNRDNLPAFRRGARAALDDASAIQPGATAPIVAQAAAQNRTAFVRVLLEEGNGDPMPKGERDPLAAPAYQAVANANLEMYDLLCAHGYDLGHDILVNLKASPLMAAARMDSDRITDRILGQEKPETARNSDWFEGLSEAFAVAVADSQALAPIRTLARRRDLWEDEDDLALNIQELTLKGTIGQLDAFLTNGPPVNRGEALRKGLMGLIMTENQMAKFFNDAEPILARVDLLMSHGADPRATSKFGPATPITKTMEHDHGHVLRRYADWGVPLSALPDEERNTALAQMLKAGSHTCLDEIIRQGVDITSVPYAFDLAKNGDGGHEMAESVQRYIETRELSATQTAETNISHGPGAF